LISEGGEARPVARERRGVTPSGSKVLTEEEKIVSSHRKKAAIKEKRLAAAKGGIQLRDMEFHRGGELGVRNPSGKKPVYGKKFPLEKKEKD